jgi:hypothetical protein
MQNEYSARLPASRLAGRAVADVSVSGENSVLVSAMQS